MTDNKDEMFRAMTADAASLLLDHIPERNEGDPTALSYWFPKIEAAGLPVPKTRLLRMSDEAHEFLQSIILGEQPSADNLGDYQSFLQELTALASEVGFPCFLRTDYTSGKHDWKDTCFVQTPDDLDARVQQIAFFSALADFRGLPFRNWAVREMLPTIPYGSCPRYGDMPVCKEFRFFVKDGVAVCRHPYWPKAALDQGSAPEDLDFHKLCALHWKDEEFLCSLAQQAGIAVGGSWSVDILETERGWFVTDMAEAAMSYHWEGCPHG